MLKQIVKTITVLVLTVFTIFLLVNLNDYFMKRVYPVKYDCFIEKFSKQYDVEKTLVCAVIKVESNFDENAKSCADAIGLMQITNETFRWLLRIENKNSKYIINLEEKDLLDPKINVKYGTFFLSYLLNKYKDEKTALAAYNAGIGKVNDWLTKKEYSEDKKTLSKIPFKETEDYVEKVFKAEEMYKNLYFKK